MNDDDRNTEAGRQQPVSRETLYELVWSQPMLKVAARFGVSSSYMSRVCTLLNVPRPERGYWAKLAFGKTPTRPSLPDARPGDELHWSRDGQTRIPDRPLPVAPSEVPKRQFRRKSPRPAAHPLVIGVKPLFDAGKLSYDVGYLKPAKKLLVDLAVTKTGLDSSLAFANALFLALEDRDHRVVIAARGEQFRRADVDEHEVPRNNHGYSNLWSPYRPTIVSIGTVAIGLTIIEMSETAEASYVDGKYVRVSELIPSKRQRHMHTWTTNHDFPTGRLCLQAYSPYAVAGWSKQWREVKIGDLLRRVPTIAAELEDAAPEIARLVAEGNVRADEERLRWKAQVAKWDAEEKARRAAEAIDESKEELSQGVDLWAKSNRFAAFFADAEKMAAQLPEDRRGPMLSRLQQARELIGSVDALERFLAWRTPEERE